MWVIKFKDICPDTGKIAQEASIATALEKMNADLIVFAMNQADEEPNREYFSVHETNSIRNDE